MRMYFSVLQFNIVADGNSFDTPILTRPPLSEQSSEKSFGTTASSKGDVEVCIKGEMDSGRSIKFEDY